MNLVVAGPAFGCLVFALFVGRRPHHTDPARSARLLVLAAVIATTALVATAAVTSAAFLWENAPHETSHRHILTFLTGHHPVSDAVGISSAIAAVVLVVRAVLAGYRIFRERRKVRADLGGLNLSSERMALAVPGRNGGIVLSRGLRSTLSAEELQIVIGHERAHLRHRHHRYLAASMVCATAIPLLRRLDANLRFTIERWADEDVAATVDDRRLVAKTIARVALPPGSLPTVPALSDVGVAARVEALLHDTPPTSRLAGAALITNAAVAGAGMIATLVQLHHLGVF